MRGDRIGGEKRVLRRQPVVLTQPVGGNGEKFVKKRNFNHKLLCLKTHSVKIIITVRLCRQFVYKFNSKTLGRKRDNDLLVNFCSEKQVHT